MEKENIQIKIKVMVHGQFPKEIELPERTSAVEIIEYIEKAFKTQKFMFNVWLNGEWVNGFAHDENLMKTR